MKRLWIVISAMTLALMVMACIFTANTPTLRMPTQAAPLKPTATPLVSQLLQPQPTFDLSKLTSNEEALLVELYQRLNPSVVNIIVYIDQGNVLAAEGQGSGFVYDAQGHIVTNAHVVHGSDAVEVVFADDTTLAAKVIGEDLHSDLAVLKVDELPKGVQPIPLGKMEEIAVGQTVIAIGNPFGLGGTMTRGIISALGRTIPALTPFSIPQAIQTDAPINPGNSGGPLLNLKGEVIGVNAQIETGGTSRANTGVGFAIPVSIIERVVPKLISDGKYAWSWLGVTGGSVSPTLQKAMNLPSTQGAYIAEVVSGGPADKAGLRGASQRKIVDGRLVETGGDVIIAVDGTPIKAFSDMLIYIALNTTPGQKVVLTIIRNGKTIEVTLTLEERPTNINESTTEFPFPFP